MPISEVSLEAAPSLRRFPCETGWVTYPSSRVKFLACFAGLAIILALPPEVSQGASRSAIDDGLLAVLSKATLLDRNGDGRVDAERVFDARGNLHAVRYDLDFDGQYDEIVNFTSDRIVRKTSTRRNGVFDHELRQELSKKGEIISERLLEARGGDWVLVREALPDHSRGTVTVTDISAGKPVISVQPLNLQDSYVGDYLDCVLGSSDLRACVASMGSYGFAVHAGSALVFGATITPFACSNDSQYFSGTGLKIEKADCTGTSTPAAISGKFRNVMAQFRSCVSPAVGKYKNAALWGALIDTLGEAVHGGGIDVQCHPGLNPGIPSAVADVNASARPMHVNIWRTDTSELTLSVLGHEFMHLSSALGPDRAIDNQPGDIHNQGNSHFDRIYACESLCFSPKPSKQDCNICMNYPNQGLGSFSACKGLPELSPIFYQYDPEVVRLISVKQQCLTALGLPNNETANTQAGMRCLYSYFTQRLAVTLKMKGDYVADASLRTRFSDHYQGVLSMTDIMSRSTYEKTHSFYCSLLASPPPPGPGTIDSVRALVTLTEFRNLPEAERRRLGIDPPATPVCP